MVAVAGDIPVIAKANAGIPQWRGAELAYSGSPEVAGAHAHRVRTAGVSIIGGCCGNEPAHLACMRAVLDGTIPVPDVEFEPASAPPIPVTGVVGVAVVVAPEPTVLHRTRVEAPRSGMAPQLSLTLVTFSAADPGGWSTWLKGLDLPIRPASIGSPV